MKFLYVLIPSTMLLYGCATMTQQEVRSIVISQCPTLVNYTPEQQKQAAQELRNLYSESQLSIMITDYSKLREACRVVTKRMARKMVKK